MKRQILGVAGAMLLATLGCRDNLTGPTATDAGSPVPVATSEVTSNTWLKRRDMPLDLVSQAAAVIPNAQGQSILYVMGGRKAQSTLLVPMGEVRAYNVA